MAPFGVGCGFMCFVALQFYVFCRAGGVGQQHQLGRLYFPGAKRGFVELVRVAG